MKKSKIFLATGTLVLAVMAIFAAKATKKFAQVTTARTNARGAVNFIIDDATFGSFPMTTAVTGNQMELRVAGNSDFLFTASSEAHAIYYR